MSIQRSVTQLAGIETCPTLVAQNYICDSFDLSHTQVKLQEPTPEKRKQIDKPFFGRSGLWLSGPINALQAW